MPEVDEDGGLGRAGLDIDELEVEVEGDAGEVFGEVAADLLAQDEVRADDVVRGEDAGAVGGEDVFVGGGGREGDAAGAVVGGAGPFGELGGCAAVEVGGDWGY